MEVRPREGVADSLFRAFSLTVGWREPSARRAELLIYALLVACILIPCSRTPTPRCDMIDAIRRPVASRIGVRIARGGSARRRFAAWKRRAGGAVDPAGARLVAQRSTLTRILHSSVYVGGRYSVRSAGLERDELRTDSRGEAVLRMVFRGRVTTCAVFQRKAECLLPPTSRVRHRKTPPVTFSVARTWCSTKAMLESSFAARQSCVYKHLSFVEVDCAQCSSRFMSASCESSRRWGFPDGMPALRPPNGTIIGPKKVRFDATDALAAARLR